MATATHKLYQVFGAIAVSLVLLPQLTYAGQDVKKAVDNAVEHPARPEADKKRDAGRAPNQVLAYFDIKPDMQVLDVFAGGGYYTEIISRVVGDEGGVTLYNNGPWEAFVAKSVEQRLTNNRLANVRHLVAAPERLASADKAMLSSYDAAIFVLGMHDIYYADATQGWPQIDSAKFLGDIYKLLKPKGTFGIIDHVAPVSSDPELTGETLHRVGADSVKRDLEAAGFVYLGRQTFLLNEFDDLTSNALAKENHGVTSRFVHLYEKP